MNTIPRKAAGEEDGSGPVAGAQGEKVSTTRSGELVNVRRVLDGSKLDADRSPRAKMLDGSGRIVTSR